MVRHVKNESFSKLFSGFHFWTFINVQFSISFLLFGIFLLLRNIEKYIASFYNGIWSQHWKPHLRPYFDFLEVLTLIFWIHSIFV
jgi:hypothetical protein